MAAVCHYRAASGRTDGAVLARIVGHDRSRDLDCLPRTRIPLPRIDMNAEIRLSILRQLYDRKFSQNELIPPSDLELPNVLKATRDANLEYLWEKQFVRGNRASAGGKVVFIAVEITADGVDIVEAEDKKACKRLGKLCNKLRTGAPSWSIVARLMEHFVGGATDV